MSGRDAKPEPGDRVRISFSGRTLEGVLLPVPKGVSRGVVFLKLDNGYNVGLKVPSSAQLSILKKKSVRTLGRKKKVERLSFDKNKTPVSLVSTGGTISARVDYETGAVYMFMEPGEILDSAPELRDILWLRSIASPFTMASEDLSPREWQALAKVVAREINNGSEGVIITHGTDTMHYSSAALSFMLSSAQQPIAFTGAQRSSDRPSSDAAMNLICSGWYATSDIGEIAIVMHETSSDTTCIAIRGTKARKMHTSRRDAFRPINELPLARISPQDGVVEKGAGYRVKKKENTVSPDTKFDESVEMVFVYPGSDPSIIDYYVSRGARGLVLMTTALGHVPIFTSQKKYSWLSHIKRAVKQGVFIVSASQTLYGSTHPHVYKGLVELDRAGVVFARDMLPEVAYVKLGWVLGHTSDIEEAKKIFLTNIAGEFSRGRDPRAYLV